MSISVRVVGVSRKCHFARLSSSEGPVLSAPTLRRAADLDSGEVMSALEDHIAELRAVCAGLPDRRKGPQPCGGYTMADIGLSAFSLFFMGSPSFLAHQRALSEGQGRSNCQSLFDTSAIPSDNYIRQMLDGAPTAAFDPLFIKAIETPEVLPPFQRLGGRILIALDGTEYHCSRKIHCSRCSTRKRSDGGTEYFHAFLGASIVAPGHQQVLPLPPEFIAPQDGAEKQDCERNAGKRWLTRHGAALKHLRPVFLGDDLFACQSMATAIQDAGGNFILTCKPSSHQTITEYLYGSSLEEHRATAVTPGKGRSTTIYRWLSGVPLRATTDAMMVNWVSIEILNSKGKRTYFNSFVTDLEITAASVADIMAQGGDRTRANLPVLRTSQDRDNLCGIRGLGSSASLDRGRRRQTALTGNLSDPRTIHAEPGNHQRKNSGGIHLESLLRQDAPHHPFNYREWRLCRGQRACPTR